MCGERRRPVRGGGLPSAPGAAPALVVCDDESNDAFAVFDLTSVASEVLGTLDPTMYDLYYYEDNADAIDNRNDDAVNIRVGND